MYPKFETRGSLDQTVHRFREWLQDQVIDIEVANNTPSPTVDPSVHTILIGHSMGGIVAAETYLILASEQPVPTASSAMNPSAPNFASNTTLSSSTGAGGSHPNPSTGQVDDTSATLMFPHIQGVIAFDTPFLGLAPSMVASQVEGAHGMASTAYSTYNEAAKIFGWNSPAANTVAGAAPSAARALPAPATSALDDAAAAPKWQSWGKVAMFAGAAGAVAAGGAAALYSQREKISAGWGWASSHLLFVGDLVRAENLRRRVEMLEKATSERGGRCVNVYNVLGRGKREGSVVGGVGGKRVFVNLPNKVIKGGPDMKKDGKGGGGMQWYEVVNDKAKDEIAAHCAMFTPKDNPGFFALGERAKSCVVQCVDQAWYAGSEARPHRGFDLEDEGTKVELDDVGEGWEKPESATRGGDKGVWDDAVDEGEGDVRLTESYEGLKGGRGEGEELEDSIIVDRAEPVRSGSTRSKSSKSNKSQEHVKVAMEDNPWR